MYQTEDIVLHGMIDRLTEIGRWYAMEMSVEKKKKVRKGTSQYNHLQ
jgi:hypothetical protein